jgi:hypothetical protein
MIGRGHWQMPQGQYLDLIGRVLLHTRRAGQVKPGACKVCHQRSFILLVCAVVCVTRNHISLATLRHPDYLISPEGTISANAREPSLLLALHQTNSGGSDTSQPPFGAVQGGPLRVAATQCPQRACWSAGELSARARGILLIMGNKRQASKRQKCEYGVCVLSYAVEDPCPSLLTEAAMQPRTAVLSNLDVLEDDAAEFPSRFSALTRQCIFRSRVSDFLSLIVSPSSDGVRRSATCLVRNS